MAKLILVFCENFYELDFRVESRWIDIGFRALRMKDEIPTLPIGMDFQLMMLLLSILKRKRNPNRFLISCYANVQLDLFPFKEFDRQIKTASDVHYLCMIDDVKNLLRFSVSFYF